MTTTKNLKQQQQYASLPMSAASGMGMAAPPYTVRTKLLLCAALGFTLGVVATLFLMTSSSSSSYSYTAVLLGAGGGRERGGGGGEEGSSVGLFLPPSAPRNAAAVQVQDHHRPPPARSQSHSQPTTQEPGAVPPAVIRQSQPPPPPPPPASTDITHTSAVRPPPPPPPSPSAPPGVGDKKQKEQGPPAAPAAPAGGNGGGRGVVVSDYDDEDDELLMARAAALAPREVPAGPGTKAVRKVAFLFLTRWDLPMAPLWDKFFHGHQGLYNVYVHTDPAFNGSEPPENSAFYRRTIPSKEVKWGEISMVEAERRLLAHALLDDHSNARFVLLSESHVPLFDLPTVHSYLVNSTQVFLESYDQPGATGRGRYNRRMGPVVTVRQWRKGSQWFDMDRALAADVVADRLYFPLFRRFCRRSCYADEHYLPTFLNIRRPARGPAAAGSGANRSVTWVDWSHGGPHPARFTRMEVTVDFLRWLRGGSTCTYNGRTTTVCFLFARKFLPNSLTRFLRFAPKVMGFG